MNMYKDVAPIYDLNWHFAKAVKDFSSKVSVYGKTEKGDISLTYRELYQEVRNLAFYLSSIGVNKGDRVVVILENRIEWPIIFFSISYIGAVTVPLDTQLPEKDILNILNDSGATFGFISDNRKLSDLFKKVMAIKNVIVVPFAADKIDAPQGFKEALISPDDLMLLLYTSGTTDLPKGVMLTHKNLCSNFNSLKALRLLSYRDVVLSILPLYHSYPLMATLITPILLGAKIVYVPSDWPERLIEYVKNTRITVFVGVPQIFNMMHTQFMKRLQKLSIVPKLYIKFASSLKLTHILVPSIKNVFGKDLRMFVSGGAKLDMNIAKDFYKLGFRILEGYGLTETSPAVSFNPIKRPKIGSVGKPLLDVKVKILDKDIEGIGEIAVKGPNVMNGYYKDAEKTEKAFKDGWFLTGDIGYIDNRGYLYITGRSKEVIVLSSGKNIFPEEIEKLYSSTPYVKELCVLGVLKQKGKGKIEYLHAIVVPEFEFFKERGEMNIRKVLKNVFENLSKDLPSYKHITGFTITQDALPRTILGKIKRYEVEKKFMSSILNEVKEEEPLTPEEESMLKTGTAERLLSYIKEALDIRIPIKLHDSIELDLGVDSLARVELLCAIENYFNIDLEEEMIAGEIFTVKDLLLKIEDAFKKSGRLESVLEGHEAKEIEQKIISWPDILKQPLPLEFKKKILLKVDAIDYIFTFSVKALLYIFFRVFYKLKVKGLDNIPPKGPYILCVNHTSFYDGFIVSSAVSLKTQLELFFIGFRIYFIAPIVRHFVARGRIIPIDATDIIEAMKAGFYILKHNKALCIFPEGERSFDGQVKEFKKGVGIIAKELNAPLIPVLIKGGYEAWSRARRFPRLHPVEVRFGNSILPDELIRKAKLKGIDDDYQAIASGIREEVVKLKIA